MGGIKKRKSAKRLAARIAAFEQTARGTGKGGGVTNAGGYRKPGSQKKK